MLANRLFRGMRFFSSNQPVVPSTPKAPRLLHGQLQPFRFDIQNAKLYDGYTLDQLYGSKIGVKHPPSIRAQMVKDTIASIVILVLGFAIILHVNWLNKEQIKQLKALGQGRQNRQVKIPQNVDRNIKMVI